MAKAVPTCEDYTSGNPCGKPAPKYRHALRAEDEGDQEIVAVCAEHACERCTPPKRKKSPPKRSGAGGGSAP